MKEGPMRKYFCLSIVLACVVIVHTASSQKVSDFDRNKDDKLDAQKSRAYLIHKFPPSGDFGKADTNKDGLVHWLEQGKRL